MSQQVNYTSAACGLANSLCSTLLRLIGRPFAFDELLFALQDRAQIKNISYTIASKTTKNKTSSLTVIVVKPPPQKNTQNQNKTTQTACIFMAYSSNTFLLPLTHK